MLDYFKFIFLCLIIDGSKFACFQHFFEIKNVACIVPIA